MPPELQAIVIALVGAAAFYVVTTVRSIATSQAKNRDTDAETNALRIKREEAYMKTAEANAAKIDVLDTRYERLETSYLKGVERQAEIEADLAISKGENDKLRADYDKLRLEFTSEQVKTMKLSKEVDRLTELSKQVGDELTTEREARKTETETHASDREEWRKVVEELKKQIETLDKRIEKLLQQLAAFEKRTNISREEITTTDDEPETNGEDKPSEKAA
jgi:chromosome segregation ATPase